MFTNVNGIVLTHLYSVAHFVLGLQYIIDIIVVKYCGAPFLLSG